MKGPETYNPANELKKRKRPIRTDNMGVIVTDEVDNERRTKLKSPVVEHNEQL